MSKSSLLQQIHSSKVEWKALGEVSEMKRGTSITKKTVVDGEIPVISGGKQPAYYCKEANRDGEIITVAGSGAGAGYVQYWDIPIFVCDAFSVKGNENISTKYLYYCLLNIQENIYATKKGSGVPHVHISSIQNFPIPIPPLDIQQKIVDILDKFTKLSAELSIELTARKKQYEYYLNKLLSFDKETEWKTLGEIGEPRMCKRILKNQTTSEGDIPFYKIGTFGKEPDSYISKELFEEYKEKYNYPKIGDILISASGTIGRTVVFDGKDAYFQDSNIVWIENDETKVSNRFLFYFYKIAKFNVAQGGTIARLYNNDLKKIQIPIPPLEKQAEIVAILDKFDKLTNSISEGLPREIELRHKQYEYYRNLLLDFPKNP